MKLLSYWITGYRLLLLLLVAGSITAFFLTREKNLIEDQLVVKKKGAPRATDAASAAEFELFMTRDVKTGLIPEGVRTLELQQAQSIFTGQLESARTTHHNSLTVQGPNNMGGRTRSVVYDVRFNGGSNQVILAGGVSGGVFKSVDNGATWVRKSLTNNLYSVTSIAQDVRPGFEDTWYYATGEAIGNSASGTGALYLGHGVFKSTDNGETWSRLTSSNTSALETFSVAQDYITRVVVNPVNGDVYAACLASTRRSQDGGATWATVLSGTLANNGQVSDIAVTSAGRFYAAFSGTCPNTVDGVWTSATGNSGDWTRIAGTGVVGNPAAWNAVNTYGRVVLAIAPSSPNLVYALYWDGTTNQVCPTTNTEAELYRWDQNTLGWTDLTASLPDEAGCQPGNDPFAVQGGYDLMVSVKPDNANVVFIGGTNIYRSTDAFATPGNVTRIGGYATPSSAALYLNSHPDIHDVAFQPGNPSIMLCGNDGGIQRTADNLAGTVAWTQINNGYNTFQYYHIAVDPRIGNSKVLGGAQDNGTTRNVGGSGTTFEMVLSGDGGAVGLSAEISGNTYEYCVVQRGEIFRRNAASLPNFASNIRPITATPAGLFVTYFRLDPDNTQTLYYVNTDTIYRNISASTANTTNWNTLTGVATVMGAGTTITSLATTRGAYNPATASLFIGTADGRILRLDDPRNAPEATAPVNIKPPLMPGTVFVSSIAVNPRNDDTVIVTVSNYNQQAIWWTGNANSASPTWRAVEGNLTLPSFRSSAIAITSSGVEYYAGTSVGLFSATIDGTSDGTAAATTWNQEGAADLGNAVVSSLALRPSDNTLIIGTHGYGMWRTQLSMSNLPVTFTSFTGRTEATSNQLAWTVEDEHNNKGFEIERKYASDPDYTKIGFVNGTNTSGTNKYGFKDISVDLGRDVVFYRLRQVDIDDRASYSPVLPLGRKISAKMVEYMSVSGNNLYVRINNGNNNLAMQLKIYDMSGRTLKNLSAKYQSQQIDISALPAGTYLVEITGRDKQRVSQKIVK